MLEVPATTTGIDGVSQIRYTTDYLVAGPHGVVSIIFNAETAGSDDPTIQTIVTHVKLAK